MYDVIIIGAGASGLMAAWDLSAAGKKVAVIEAKNRIGGRIFDIADPRFSSVLELGAEFIHGDLELTQFILKKANAEIYERRGDVFKFENGKIQDSDFIEDYSTLHKKFKQLEHDISVQQFLDKYLYEEANAELRESLKRYVEGYYAADLNLVSTFALRDEFENSSEKQYGIEGGYTKLLAFVENELKLNHCDVFLASPVTKVEWQEGAVTVTSDNNKFTATKILITVSIGVLRSGSLQLIPNIDEITEAAKHLGFGNVIKLILQFDKAFWKNKTDLQKLSFLFSEENIPTWWTAYPKEYNMLVGWLGGPSANDMRNASEQEIITAGLDSLSRIFNTSLADLQRMLITGRSYNWIEDPYTCGAYSFDVVNGYTYKQIIRQPIANTIYFAGEGLYDGPEIGTVEAALQTGRKAAQQMMK